MVCRECRPNEISSSSYDRTFDGICNARWCRHDGDDRRSKKEAPRQSRHGAFSTFPVAQAMGSEGTEPKRRLSVAREEADVVRHAAIAERITLDEVHF